MSMYDTTDPRSALNAPAKSSVPPPTEYAAAEYAKFYETKPQEDDKNGKTWYARGQNFIIAYTEAAPGATFARKGQADEYVVLLHDAATTVDLSRGLREEVDRRLYGDVRSAGRQHGDLAEGRSSRAHVHDALGRHRGEVRERGKLCQAASEHSAVRALADAEGRLQDPQLQP